MATIKQQKTTSTKSWVCLAWYCPSCGYINILSLASWGISKIINCTKCDEEIEVREP